MSRHRFAVGLSLALLLVLLLPSAAIAVDPNPGVNDQPDVILAGSTATTPGTAVAIPVSVVDPDEHLLDMELEIDISDVDGVGGRSVPAGDYGTFSWGFGTSVTSDIEVDPEASLNTALGSFMYTPPDGFSGLARIVFEIDDQGNIGTGGVLSRTRFIDINVAASGDADPDVNNQPDITLPGTQTTAPGTPISFAPVVSDLDVGPFDMEIEIDISDVDGVGGRSVSAGDYGTFSWGGGAAITSDIELDSMAQVNTFLSTFTYTPPPGFSGLARIVFEIDDQGNTGSAFPNPVLSRTRFIDINVAAPGDADPDINDPPDITLPSGLTTGVDTPLPFAPTLSDPDVGPFDMEMEIDISDLDGVGGLSVPAGDYGTFSWGGGSGLTSEIELDSLADLNTFLSTFTYTPAPGFTGLARIVFEIDDQGNTGSAFPNPVLSRTRFIDIQVEDAADLAVIKTAPSSVASGGSITYAITLTNNGPGAAQSVSMSDSVPADTTFVSMTQTSGPAATLTTPPVGGTGVVTATLASLASGQSLTFDLTVQVDPPTPDGTVITNTVTAATTTPDPDSANNTDDATTTIVPPADVSVTKTADATVVAGGTITYAITLTNNGPGAAQSVSMSDSVPADTTFVSMTQTSGPAATLTTPPVGGTGVVTATLASLASGQSLTFDLTVQVDPPTPDGTVITNTVTAATTTPDPDSANNTDDATTTIAPEADVSVTKTANATVVDGENLTYTITVTNDGPSAATAVALSDTLPTGTTFVSATQNSGPAAVLTTPPVGGTGTVTATIASLPNGESASLTIVVNTEGTAGTDIVNTATVSAATADPDDSDNEAAATTQSEVGEADLAITKTGATEVAAGAELTYTLAIVNDGPNDAVAVEVTDSLPASTTFVSLEQDEGPDAECEVPDVGATGMISCTIPELVVDDEATFTLVVRVDAAVAAGTTISNTASVVSENADPVTDNSSTADATVLGVAATALDPTSPAAAAAVAQPATAATQTLPATGRDLDLQVVIALLLFVGGGGFLAASRQRTLLDRRRLRAPRG